MNPASGTNRMKEGKVTLAEIEIEIYERILILQSIIFRSTYTKKCQQINNLWNSIPSIQILEHHYCIVKTWNPFSATIVT